LRLPALRSFGSVDLNAAGQTNTARYNDSFRNVALSHFSGERLLILYFGGRTRCGRERACCTEKAQRSLEDARQAAVVLTYVVVRPLPKTHSFSFGNEVEGFRVIARNFGKK
jgi:hypothetical protein